MRENQPQNTAGLVEALGCTSSVSLRHKRVNFFLAPYGTRARMRRFKRAREVYNYILKIGGNNASKYTLVLYSLV